MKDLELARRCAEGDEQAWETFVREYRPLLYRAADALDPTQGARDIADSLYADLYGIARADGRRQSLFHYYEGRSSLGTWLRAVLAQRFVDRLRSERRMAPLADDGEDPPHQTASGSREPDFDRERYVALVQQSLRRAVAALEAQDRLRLSCYYVQALTLAQTGRILRESEASTSRHLARTRLALRRDVERELRETARLSEPEIAACLASVVDDPGSLDLKQVIYE